MTGQFIRLTIHDMTKRGRPKDSGTPSEFRKALVLRTREARKHRTRLDQAGMAKELSRRSHREISPDTYRQYEAVNDEKPTLIPYDLIVPFCDITQLHPFEFLRPIEGETTTLPMQYAPERRAASGR